MRSPSLFVTFAALMVMGCAVDSAPESNPRDPLQGSASDPDAARSGETREDEDPEEQDPEERLCMGDASYCDRPYNQLAQVCTHNAMSTEEAGFALPTPNQVHSLTQQLDAGVRCLMLDIHNKGGEAYLCHGACGVWGERPLSEGLDDIALWMDAHPNEVVTFILESYVPESLVFESLVSAGLASSSDQASESAPLYYHDAEPGTPWPSIGEMIASNQRLVVFTDDDEANGSWHLDWRVYGWETPFNDASFSCEDLRGDPKAYDNQVFILNHYTLCELGGCVSNAVENNAFDVALERAQRCWQVDEEFNPWGQIPTFVNVDHYQSPTLGGPSDEADILEVVRALNAQWPQGP